MGCRLAATVRTTGRTGGKVSYGWSCCDSAAFGNVLQSQPDANSIQWNSTYYKDSVTDISPFHYCLFVFMNESDWVFFYLLNFSKTNDSKYSFEMKILYVSGDLCYFWSLHSTLLLCF